MHRDHRQKTGDFIQAQQRKYGAANSNTIHLIVTQVIHQNNRQNSHRTVIGFQQCSNSACRYDHQQFSNGNFPVGSPPVCTVLMRFFINLLQENHHHKADKQSEKYILIIQIKRFSRKCKVKRNF